MFPQKFKMIINVNCCFMGIVFFVLFVCVLEESSLII